MWLSFSSPIGESTFSTAYTATTISVASTAHFRPLSGNLLSLHLSTRYALKAYYNFRPLSGNLLSLPETTKYKKRRKTIFVPYRGIYFLYNLIYLLTRLDVNSFSSPIGESTFSTESKKHNIGGKKFSSPIGESTFSTFTRKIGRGDNKNFRPLSGNLLSLPDQLPR